MKIVVLAPSAYYAANAGARIRYARIAPFLNDRGITLTIEPLAAFDPRRAACDIVIISKCYDAHALLAAEILGRRGVAVGFDLFDDYFSQSDDSRLIQRRAWLAQMVCLSRFALCSTAVTANIVRGLAPSLPVHVMNDPAPPFDDRAMGLALRDKMSAARTSAKIRVGWFGIGDNPHFAVGLSDLSAFASVLGQLATSGFAVELSILTNARSLDAAGLAAIANLPVATTVGLWSEAAEAELLSRSLLCFLPVNAQRFSIAKSLNRAITALAGGCQLLSVGYPLYAALDPLIYREADDFIGDLRAGAMRFSADTLALFKQRIEQFASPERESAALASFLQQLSTSVAARPVEKLYLVHGVASSRAAHVLAKRAGALSVKSPFSDAALDYDVMFAAGAGKRLAMILSNSAIRQTPSAIRRQAVVRRIAGRKYWEIADPALDGGPDGTWRQPSLPLQLALYPWVMQSIGAMLERTFGPGRVLLSENSHLPFEPGS
jgi:hypothetical protein